MELRKRKNIQYNLKNKFTPEEMDVEEIENSNSLNSKPVPTKTTRNNNKRKRNSDSEYEYASTNESKSGVSTTGSKISSNTNKKKKNKKKYEIYNIISDTEEDVIADSTYDPIIQQNVTITTPLRIMKKLKFKYAMNEVVDLVGDSDEDIETITILDSDDNKDIIVETVDLTKNEIVKKGTKRKNNDNDDDVLLIDLSGDETNTNNPKKSKRSTDIEKSDYEKSDTSSTKKKSKETINNHEKSSEEEVINNKSKKQKRAVISEDEENSINKSNSDSNSTKRNLRNSSKKSKTNLSSDEQQIINDNVVIELSSDRKSESNSIIHDLENMFTDDIPSGSLDSIEISSDESDDDILEIEISDDDRSKSSKQKRSSKDQSESSMKKSIEQRSSRIKEKNENRLLTLKRLKERKRKPIDSINPYEDVIGNEDSSSEEEVRPLRYLTEKNDDFIVSDSGNEEVYFLTTKWDIKQRKKLYKAFKRLYKFCIAILIYEPYIKKNINDLKKAFQIINKRINYVCKKITPVPPWDPKFQTYIDSYPYVSVKSQYPKNKCDSCRKNITSTFAVSFSGNKYNKLSLKDISSNESKKEKERIFVIDRVCLERVQIYHGLYHFKYNTLKEIEQKMKEKGLKISELRKTNDENKVENVFSELKINCKEDYTKLSGKLKNGENYIPNSLDV